MAAIIESALPDVGMKFDKPPRQILPINMIQAEFLHAGRIDYPAILVEVVESSMGSGMASGIERDGNTGGGAFRSRDESIDKSGFTHAGLTYQNAEMAFQVGQKRDDIVLGADFQRGDSLVPDRAQGGSGSACGFSEVSLVKYDQRLDTLVLGSGETAVY